MIQTSNIQNINYFPETQQNSIDNIKEKSSNYSSQFDSSSSIGFSANASKILEVNNGLDKIFGKPNSLNVSQQQEVDSINKEIDKILGIDSSLSKEEQGMVDLYASKLPSLTKKYTKEEEVTMRKLFREIDKLLEDQTLSKREERKLRIINAKLAEMSENPDVKRITLIEEQQLDKLFARLDNISGISPINKDDLVELNKDTQSTEKFSIIPKKLNEEEKQKEQIINKEINKILDVKEISKSNQAIANKAIKQIDALFVDNILTPEEEKELERLESKLKDIYVVNTNKILNKEEQAKLDKLFAQLDELYGFKTLSKEELIQADKLFNELELVEESLPQKNTYSFPV